MIRFTLDGTAFRTLEEFAAHFSLQVLNGYEWQGNLDAFNDILRGGFGTPDDGFEIVWLHSDESRKQLGYLETVRQLELRLSRCHPDNRSAVTAELHAARSGRGSTVFDWIVELLRIHGPGGGEQEDNVRLTLQ